MGARCRTVMFFLAITSFSTSAAATVDATISEREDNSYGVEGDWDEGGINLGEWDCLDDVVITVDISLSGEDSSGREIYIFSGDSCDDDDYSDECDDDVLEYDSDTTSVEIYTSWILDDEECDASYDTSVWVGLLTSSGELEDDASWADPIDVDYSVTSPDAPEGISVGVGEENLLVEWDDSDDDDLIGFLVVYAKATDSEVSDAGIECEGPLEEGAELSEVWSYKEAGEGSTSLRVKSLTNGTTYQVAVSAVDENGNASPLSEVLCAVPEETTDFFEAYSDAGGSGGGEYCFIATGAFGDYDHPVVKRLRRFRDEFLLKMPMGELVVAGYYSVGPKMVALVGDDEVMWEAIRTELRAFARVTDTLVELGARLVLLAMALFLLSALFRFFMAGGIPWAGGRVHFSR